MGDLQHPVHKSAEGLGDAVAFHWGEQLSSAAAETNLSPDPEMHEAPGVNTFLQKPIFLCLVHVGRLRDGALCSQSTERTFPRGHQGPFPGR